MHRLLSSAAIAVGMLSAPEQAIAQNMWKDSAVELPLPQHRQVIGVWRIVTPLAPVTRAIERVGNQYYMVARVTGENGERIGGTHGTLLEKTSETSYRFPRTKEARYEIKIDGALVGYNDDEAEPFMRAEPYPHLWVR